MNERQSLEILQGSGAQPWQMVHTSFVGCSRPSVVFPGLVRLWHKAPVWLGLIPHAHELPATC